MMILAQERIERVVIACKKDEMSEVIKDYKSRGYLYTNTADILYTTAPKALTFDRVYVIPTNEQLQSYTW